jgi:hypothetical protein
MAGALGAWRGKLLLNRPIDTQSVISDTVRSLAPALVSQPECIFATPR